MLYSIITLVKDIQRVYRGHLARRESATRLRSVCKLQAWQRMLVLRRRWKRMQAAAVVLQVGAYAIDVYRRVHIYWRRFASNIDVQKVLVFRDRVVSKSC